MDSRQRADLDRHVTGNYGEDQFSREEARIEEAVVILSGLSEEARLDVFANFCVYCGGEKLPCTCMRDD